MQANGDVLLQSLGFDSPKVAGQTIAALQGGPSELEAAQPFLQPIAEHLRDVVLASLQEVHEAKLADEKK